MKKIFLDMDGTLARFNIRNALNRFETEEGFFAKLKAYKNIEMINEMAKTGNVYIISASPHIKADNDKMQWIKKYLPSLQEQNVIFCRIGENKAEIIKIKTGLDIKGTYLLDDYTKNLEQWETAGGVGIKRLTSVADNSTGKWKGLSIKNLNQLEKIVNLI